MSGAGPRLALRSKGATLPKGRAPLAHLLHALNQPLTGLQCSLELAAAGPRRAEEYVRILREGLELTDRMRILVEAIRELADAPPSDTESVEPFQFDVLLGDIVGDLLPVAEAKSVRLLLVDCVPLTVRANRRGWAGLLFRWLESALSLAQEGSDLRIAVTPERERACLVVCWNPGLPPEHSPFSRQELGLLIAQAGWERAGAEWTHTRAETIESCSVRWPSVLWPLASPFAAPQPSSVGDLS